jgi:thioredoxin reductase (NADPH)
MTSYCHTYENDGTAFVSVGTGVEALKHGLLCQQYASRLTTVISDPSAADHELTDRLRKIGSEVLVGTVESAAVLDSGQLRLVTAAGRELLAGTVVLDLVIRPNQRLPRALGLELNAHGYPRTTLFGQTSNPLVYSTGNSPGSPYLHVDGSRTQRPERCKADLRGPGIRQLTPRGTWRRRESRPPIGS